MQQFKHYSFDLWSTLIRPNPEFKEKRKHYFHAYFLKKGHLISGDNIEAIFKDVWAYFDNYSQLFGKAPNPLEMYAMVIFRATGSLQGISVLDMNVVYNDVEKLFLAYPPSLYDEDTKLVLEELNIRGKTMSILSNTAFIGGKTLDKVLDMHGIKSYFMFRTYSDEFGYCKPWKDCFRHVDNQLAYDTEDIIHVGDNELADGAGAQEYGFSHLIINQPKHKAWAHYTIKDLL